MLHREICLLLQQPSGKFSIGIIQIFSLFMFQHRKLEAGVEKGQNDSRMNWRSSAFCCLSGTFQKIIVPVKAPLRDPGQEDLRTGRNGST